VVEQAVLQGGGGDAGPAAHHVGAVRAGVALPDQNLGGESPFEVPSGPVQEFLRLSRGQAEHQAQVHVVPAVQLERLHLLGIHARDRLPGHQPGIGVTVVRAGRRLIGIGGRNRLASATFPASQGIEPQAEPFVAKQAPDLRGPHHQRVTHRDLRILAIPEQAPAVAEEPVAVGVEEFWERIG
jgi:hypothetical protein